MLRLRFALVFLGFYVDTGRLTNVGPKHRVCSFLEKPATLSMRVLQLHFLQPLVSYRWLALIIEETMALARAPGPPRDYQHPEQPRA